jgi:PhnB protein
MISSTPYLHFDGNCREAIAFYNACLEGVLHIISLPGSDGKPSSNPAEKVMHSQITLNGLLVIQASDSTPSGPPKSGTNFSVSVNCESAGELERAFDALSQGGTVLMALGETPWGRFGMLTDKFGIQWMLNFAPQQS